VLAETIGFRALEPLDVAESGVCAEQAFRRYRKAMVLRLALTTSPMIWAAAVCFMRDDGIWPYLEPAVSAIPVMVFEIWPSRRSIDQFARGWSRTVEHPACASAFSATLTEAGPTTSPSSSWSYCWVAKGSALRSTGCGLLTDIKVRSRGNVGALT